MVKSYLSTVIVKLLENHSKENCFMKIKEDIIINVKVKYHEMFAVCGLYFNIVWHLFYLLYSSSCCIEFTKSRSIYCFKLYTQTTTIPIPSDKNAVQVHYGLLSDLMHHSTKVSSSNRFCEKTVIKVIYHLSEKTPDFSLITSEKTFYATIPMLCYPKLMQ